MESCDPAAKYARINAELWVRILVIAKWLIILRAIIVYETM